MLSFASAIFQFATPRATHTQGRSQPTLRGVISALSTAAAVLAATPSHAEGAGRLFFIEPANGHIVTGAVNRNGQFVKELDGDFLSEAGRDVVVPVAAGALIYNSFAGGGQEFVLDGNARYTFGSSSPFSAQWFYTIGLGEYVFFYDLNGDTSQGALVQFSPNGTFTQTYTAHTFSPWSLVAPTDNSLFFYNKTTGLLSTATISVTGQLSQNGAAATIGSGYTNLAAAGDDVLLFNFHNGAWESGLLNFVGGSTPQTYTRAVVHATDTLGLSGMDEAVAIDGRLLVYNSATGAAMLGHFQRVGGSTPAGAFIKDTNLTLPKFFTNLMRAGEFLVFYSLGTGEMQIGYLDLSGAYHQTEDFNFGIGFSAMVSSQ